MVENRGGYRQPSSPAAVSGPGAYSARTDGQPIQDIPNADYGEQSEYRSLQQGAPLARKPHVAPGRGGGQGAAPPQVTPFGAPSERPGEPVTAGADAGPGPGQASLGLPMDPLQERKADVANIPPGMIQAMIAASQRPNATASFKRLVKNTLANR